MNFVLWVRAQWDRTAAVVAFGAGGLFLVLGWVRISQEALTAAQIPYVLSGGLGGIALIGLGAVAWLSADLRDEWRKLDDLERAISRLDLHVGPAVPSDRNGPVDTPLSNGAALAAKPLKPKPRAPLKARGAAAGAGSGA